MNNFNRQCSQHDCYRNALTNSSNCWNHLKNKHAYRSDIVRLIQFQPLLQNSEFAEADLSDLNLQGLIAPYSNFRGSYLSNSILSYANLNGANFSRCTLNRTDISHSNLQFTNFNGSKAEYLMGQRSNFRNASAINCMFPHINLEHAILDSSIWNGASLGHAILNDISADNLVAAWIDLSYSEMSESSFQMAVLGGANMENVVSRNSNYSRANLIGINGILANFERSNFFYARLASSCLDHANLSFSNLNRTILRSASLVKTIMEEANCDGAIFDRSLQIAIT